MVGQPTEVASSPRVADLGLSRACPGHGWGEVGEAAADQPANARGLVRLQEAGPKPAGSWCPPEASWGPLWGQWRPSRRREPAGGAFGLGSQVGECCP